MEAIRNNNEALLKTLNKDSSKNTRRDFLRDKIRIAEKTGDYSPLLKPSFTKVLFDDIAHTFPYLSDSGKLKPASSFKQKLMAYTLNAPAVFKMLIAVPFHFNIIDYLLAGVLSLMLLPFLSMLTALSIAFTGKILFNVAVRLKELHAKRGQADLWFIYLNNKNIKKFQSGEKSPLLPLKILIHEFFHNVPGYKNYFVQETFSSIYLNLLMEGTKIHQFGTLNIEGYKKGLELAKKDFENIHKGLEKIMALFYRNKMFSNMDLLANHFNSAPKNFMYSMMMTETYELPFAVGGYISGIYMELQSQLKNKELSEAVAKLLAYSYMQVIESSISFQYYSYKDGIVSKAA